MEYKYQLYAKVVYKSKRYGKRVILPSGYKSDGATGAPDLSGPMYAKDLRTGKIVRLSLSYFVHDKLCEDMCWADGTPASNWQQSMVLKDILKEEGRWFRDAFWGISTFIFRALKTRQL